MQKADYFHNLTPIKNIFPSCALLFIFSLFRSEILFTGQSLNKYRTAAQKCFSVFFEAQQVILVSPYLRGNWKAYDYD